MIRPLVSIAETRQFTKRAESRLTSEERDDLHLTLAANPTAGDLISGGGGIRKLRFRIRGRGKSGGVRVIYYFYDETVPVALLTL